MKGLSVIVIASLCIFVTSQMNGGHNNVADLKNAVANYTVTTIDMGMETCSSSSDC